MEAKTHVTPHKKLYHPCEYSIAVTNNIQPDSPLFATEALGVIIDVSTQFINFLETQIAAEIPMLKSQSTKS